MNEEGRSENESVTEEPEDLTKSEEACLNTLTDSLHLEESGGSTEDAQGRRSEILRKES